MEYSILKEVDPDVTTEKIISILNNLEISTEEIYYKQKKENIYNPCSLRVQIKNCSEYGTNGKGHSYKNARASAYAEFIERCQNNLLMPQNCKDYYFAPDEKIEKAKILESNIICKIITNKNNLYHLNVLANKLGIDFDDETKTILVPFYSLKDKKAVNLPILIFRLLQTSNGMAAGNSIEEALVQGLSEICERFAIKKVIEENIFLPDIPIEEYEKYKNIKGIIDIFNENNYEVYVKDASLGLGFPVVCVVIMDKIRNTISLSFGAHPSLPIAIERCLTEFCQGIDITNRTEKVSRWNYVSKEIIEHNIKNNNLKFIAEKMKIYKLFIQECDYLEKQFFKNPPNYNFSRNSWIKDDKNVSNKFLLKFILKSIKNYTDEIYVRDVSFLGFSSIYIIIPKMSFIFEYDEDRIKTRKSLYDWIQKEESEEKQSIKILFESLNNMKTSLFFQDILISEFPKEYLLFLCSIYEKNYKNIDFYGNLIIKENESSQIFKQNFIDQIKIILSYFKLKNKKNDDDKIYRELQKKYNINDIKRTKVFLENLTFDIIKNKIISYKQNKKRKKQTTTNKAVFDRISHNIAKKCKENVTNQNHLSEIFENLNN